MSQQQDREVVFWVSREEGLCRWNNDPRPPSDPGLITDGGVCAYQDDIQKTFICNAPEQICWYFRDNCIGQQSNGTWSAGDHQRMCTNPLADGDENKVWCCSEETLCPTSSSSWNICLGAWDSPVAGLNSVDAYSFMSSVLGTSTIGTSTIVGNAPVFSSTTASLVVQAASVTTSSVAASGTGSSASQSIPSATATSTGASSDEPNSSHSSNGVSGGAIAGIVIGVVVALLAVAGFFWYRRKKNRQLAQSNHATMPEQSQHQYAPQGWAPEGKPMGAQASEMMASNQPAEIMTHTRMSRPELP